MTALSLLMSDVIKPMEEEYYGRQWSKPGRSAVYKTIQQRSDICIVLLLFLTDAVPSDVPRVVICSFGAPHSCARSKREAHTFEPVATTSQTDALQNGKTKNDCVLRPDFHFLSYTTNGIVASRFLSKNQAAHSQLDGHVPITLHSMPWFS